MGDAMSQTPHWLSAFVCAATLSLSLAAAPANAAPASDVETVEARLQIDTSQSGGSPAVLARRLEERANIVLRHAKILPGDEGDVGLRIVVREIGGDEPGYLIRFELRAANGASVMDDELVECELCTETELVARVETELQSLVATIREVSSEPTPSEDEDKDPATVEPPPSDGRAAKGSAGLLAGGIAGLVLGGSSLAAGIGLAIPAPKVAEDDPLDLITTRPVGYGLIAGGVVVAVVGGALIGLAVKRRRAQAPVSIVPDITRGYAGVSVGWRLP